MGIAHHLGEEKTRPHRKSDLLKGRFKSLGWEPEDRSASLPLPQGVERGSSAERATQCRRQPDPLLMTTMISSPSLIQKTTEHAPSLL